MDDAAHDHDDASDIATSAGTFLLGLRAEAASGGPPTQVGSQSVDRRAHDLIVSALSRTHPGDPVLSEEDADDLARLASRRVWVVDPLDGTREYHEVSRSDWAVHVALVVDGVPLAGAVALPARGLTLGTRDAPVSLPPMPSRVRLVVSRTRPASSAEAIAAALNADVVPMGSAGAKTAAVVLGEAEAYVHDGGQYEWDSAAPVAVAVAAGLHVSRLDGSPLRYNQPDPWLPDLLICRPELAAAAIAAARSR